MRKDEFPAAADLFGDLLDSQPTAKAPRFRQYIPGLTLAVIGALAAAWLSDRYGAPLMLMGLLIGLALNFTNTDVRLHPGLNFASSNLLRWGIVLAGLQITIWQIASLGWISLIWVALMVAAVTAVGALVARAMRLPISLGILSGGAVAICGASAALALHSLLGEKRSSQAQLTLVLVTISAASALAMSFYPAIAHALNLSDRQAGWFLGASIHDVAQALGAGYSYSDEAGQTAAIVKLTRVTMLAPALAIIGLLLHVERGAGSKRFGFPWFVVGFLLLGLANSFVTIPEYFQYAAKVATQGLLCLAVTATGIRSQMALLLSHGWRGMAPVAISTVAIFLLAIAGALLIG